MKQFVNMSHTVSGAPAAVKASRRAPAADRPTARDAFREARHTFLHGDRVDMRALARNLQVDRATLYRWVGSREKLLTEILWSLISRTIETLRAEPASAGPASAGPASAEPAGAGPGAAACQSPAAAVIDGTVRAVIANPGMQRFIEREGELALRLLTTRATGFEGRLITLIAQFFDAEAAAGRLRTAIPPADLPYVVVRIMESYIYLGLITGEHPDADRAARVINALLPSAAPASDSPG
jgi:AcrR family transcriptional regulator